MRLETHRGLERLLEDVQMTAGMGMARMWPLLWSLENAGASGSWRCSYSRAWPLLPMDRNRKQGGG